MINPAKDSKIYIAGHNGMVGSAIVRKLEKNGFTNLVYKSSKDLDLTNQAAVENFFKKEQPHYVFLAAAKVGGIVSNQTQKGQYIYDNLMIQNNVIHQAYLSGVKKLVFLGSSCIYPKLAQQPLKEEYLLTGLLEPTNDAYALAKIAGLKMCQAYNEQYGTDFISLMPTNLYGPNDNYDPTHSHVLPAFIRRFHEAKINNIQSVTCWGSGTPKREFLHVDDLAEACYYFFLNYSGNEIINIGTGKDISIKELAELIKQVVGYEGEVIWDTNKPDGTPRKLLDVSKANSLGWNATIELSSGIRGTYTDHFLKQ